MTSLPDEEPKGIKPSNRRIDRSEWHELRIRPAPDARRGAAARRSRRREANRLKTLDLYAKALVASSADAVLQQRLQEAWRGVQALPADATLDVQVAAAHKLISAMVLSFRAPAAHQTT